MASPCIRFISRKTANKISSLKSTMKTSSTTKSASSRFPRPTSSATPSPLRRFSVSRTPSELGCAQSLFPLHSAVAATRMTSCLSLLTRCRALYQDEFDGT
ncbi:unnamed protein product [Rhodiola kirilowii]